MSISAGKGEAEWDAVTQKPTIKHIFARASRRCYLRTSTLNEGPERSRGSCEEEKNRYVIVVVLSPCVTRHS